MVEYNALDGLDVHKETIPVALPGRDDPVIIAGLWRRVITARWWRRA